ncbi:helix-turn-helix transcriptional regulator [Anaeromicropila populeti]|uniref:Predicted DNA-binding transcriptional regulator YafY, contains an HTH and WYL domains n=1 Tax=Anaeromicropila populeti TaxID=37658 RepID=A0A1I6LNH4_9FIRM|nr:YafY family protein [Anaeromicropila populeti]SFS05067.1 Predicted DNA-binding transcriptional regulator YafY, contains an HTH and WYL domains [Anaeromicropila populeti]
MDNFLCHNIVMYVLQNCMWGDRMQINRMFEMVYILLDRKIVTARELAERFEVSQRTIYRDVEALSAVGIPIFMTKGKGGGISILDNFVLNKAVLTKEERNDILSAMKAIDAIRFNSSNSTLKKLSSLFGEKNTDWIEVDFSSWYNMNKESENFHAIKHSILSKRVISFIYLSSKGEQTLREVEPLKLCFKDMSRYLYAYCTLRNDFRFFKLSRIQELVITEKPFERTAESPLFSKEPFNKEPLSLIILRISSKMAYRVYDEFDNYSREPDGNFIVQMNCPLGEWIFPYIASFGSSCEVIQPLDLRNKVKEELQKTLNNYL